MKILIVEDDRALRDVFELLLDTWVGDIECFKAATLEEAFRLVSRHTFSMVILDYHLEDRTCEPLLHSKGTAKVVVVSADNRVVELKDNPMIHKILLKPFMDSEIEDLIFMTRSMIKRVDLVKPIVYNR